MRLLLVHGRSQGGKVADELERTWVEALKEGVAKAGLQFPSKAEIRFPYYGDRLDELAGRFGVPLSDDIKTRGGSVNPDYQRFREEMFGEIQKRAGITNEQVSQELDPGVRTRGPQNWEWVQAILRALDKHIPGMSEATLDAFTRDVYVYLNVPGVRTEIDRIVAESLSQDPTVVVGHSLGSVITYSVLRSDPRRLQVPLYVTVGSPLAVRSVRDAFRPLKFPTVAGTWFNGYDNRDVVALYPLDEDSFPVKPAIENDGSLRNDTDNRHGITGYLKLPAVAKRIVMALA